MNRHIKGTLSVLMGPLHRVTFHMLALDNLAHLGDGHTLVSSETNNNWVTMDNIPCILVYKATIFGAILTFKLWGSAYTRVMANSQESTVSMMAICQRRSLCVSHTRRGPLSRSLGLRGYVGESVGGVLNDHLQRVR